MPVTPSVVTHLRPPPEPPPPHRMVSLHGSSTITTFPHKNLQDVPSFVQPASTTTLCLVPSGPPLSLLPTIPTTWWSSLLVNVSSMTPGRNMLPCPPASSRPWTIMTSPLFGNYVIFHSSLIYLFTAVERVVALGLCDWNRTYKRHAIGITPTREMQLESHLQETCNWNRTYKRDVIGIAPTRLVR